MLSLPSLEFDDKILMQGAEISRKLDQLRQEKFPPDARKTLRRFAMAGSRTTSASALTI